MKTALITGVTGQDGTYLSKLLLEKNYKVVGLLREYNSNIKNLEYLKISDSITFECCDLKDISQIISLIKKYAPDEIYNLAAQSSVALSFKQPIETIEFNTISVLNLLEAIRLTKPDTKFYQASTSEMYGGVKDMPVTLGSPLSPLSPYAVSKTAGHLIANNYKISYGIYVCCGILFNHESFLRAENFFVKKVIQNAIQISKGKLDKLMVGNIDVKRDFGYVPDYVEAIWKMMQNKNPDNYIICSGHSISLKGIIEYVFSKFNISNDKIIVDKNLYRPSEIMDIYGDNSKAKAELGWNYTKSFFSVLDILIKEEVKASI